MGTLICPTCGKSINPLDNTYVTEVGVTYHLGCDNPEAAKKRQIEDQRRREMRRRKR